MDCAIALHNSHHQIKNRKGLEVENLSTHTKLIHQWFIAKELLYLVFTDIYISNLRANSKRSGHSCQYRLKLRIADTTTAP